MATRKPLYLDFDDGLLREFDAGDSFNVTGVQDKLVSGTNIKTINGSSVLGSGNLSVSSSVEITQTEIDFGATPVDEGTFNISHTGVDSTTKILASVAYDAPTGKELDELEMDDLIIRAGNPTTNQFTLFIRAADGSYLEGKFKINYTLYNTPA